MRNAVYYTQFKRDMKRLHLRGYDMEKLKEAMQLLIVEEPLPERYKDHALRGEWRLFRDLHVEPDWLLIYKIDGADCIFARTGTHADLFSK